MADDLEDRLARYRADLDAAVIADLARRRQARLPEFAPDVEPHSSDTYDLIRLESTMNATHGRRRFGFVVAAVAVAATVVTLVIVSANNNDPATVPADTPEVPVSTSVPDLRVPATDVEIATAALVSDEEIGSDWTVDQMPSVAWSPVMAPDPVCAHFRDTVFVSQGVPATMGTRTFLSGLARAGFQQTVLVFPEEAAATAMMDAVARPSFGDCWAAYVFESANAAYRETGESHHVDAAPLGQVGDQLEVVGIEGTR